VQYFFLKGLRHNQSTNSQQIRKEQIMKKIFAYGATAVLLFGLGFAQPAMSQDKGATKATQNGNRNQGKIRPNFVDANGDGICDNAGTGGGTGVCTGTGAGSGKGTGVCNGTGQRLRLRDGSCGITPAPAGAATRTQGKGRAK
jgi:hypothetical protein